MTINFFFAEHFYTKKMAVKLLMIQTYQLYKIIKKLA